MNTGGSVQLDTNIVVAHFRNDIDLTARLRSASALYLPWIVLGELSYGASLNGARRAQRREAQMALIRDFLQTATLLLPHQSASELYAEVKAELAGMGKPSESVPEARAGPQDCESMTPRRDLSSRP